MPQVRHYLSFRIGCPWNVTINPPPAIKKTAGAIWQVIVATACLWNPLSPQRILLNIMSVLFQIKIQQTGFQRFILRNIIILLFYHVCFIEWNETVSFIIPENLFPIVCIHHDKTASCLVVLVTEPVFMKAISCRPTWLDVPWYSRLTPSLPISTAG